ncbi:DUF6773 family protein [Acetobacterium woodii]|uniref:Transmembrane protein n=1 Tax=Acetobacterium woodii (strain ATCC 29683 / DSM 1030 / JCM 2381 / KCTC 1655 / WB1) TaxID=931626 RepID=H6LB39_ACEWD|nr:DUF6773 family protein [Acetobacterium woodii]AFA47591.1 hypothetical protein Awo_c07970 [Acetobacterium woodii DSM 1030]
MKKFKKVIDERQEMELYKVEHIWFWIVFWLLLGSIIIQAFFLNAPFSQWGFEWFIFMICCIGSFIGYYRKGQWDYYSKPSVKSYLLYSLIGSGIFAIIVAISLALNNDYLKNDLLVLVFMTLFIFVMLFIIMFVVFFISGSMIKKRQQKLADEFTDNDPQ